MLKHIALRVFLSFSVILGVLSAAHADQAAFRSAETVREIKALGAQQMTGQSIERILSGRKFENSEWTWEIRSNGTHFSRAKDNSWTDEGPWEIVGNQYCRSGTSTGGKTICSDVYFLGRDLRFTEDRRPRRLLDWFVSY